MVATAGTLVVKLEGYHCRVERASVSADPIHRVVAARVLDKRPVQVWTVPVDDALEVEVQHVRELWDESGSGAVPVDWLAPNAVATAPYLFDMEELEVVQKSATHSSFVLVLRERVV